MVYGYARVSTRGQARDGNSIEGQERALLAAGCAEVYKESCTGTRMDRPVFAELVGKLKQGDRLVVVKMDRFARTAAKGIETIRGLLAKGVSVHILNMGLIDDTPTGRLMVTMLLAFAEFERDMILERTATGKAIAKAGNPEYKEGRPEKSIDETVLKRMVQEVAAKEKSVVECCRELGISRGTWYKRVAAG